MAARVAKGIDKEVARTDIVNPHGAAGRHAVFAADALDSAAADQEFLKHAGIEFGKTVEPRIQGRSVVATALDGHGAPTADNGLDKAAYQIIGQRRTTAGSHEIALAYQGAAAVAYYVAPLVSVSEAFVSHATSTQIALRGISIACSFQNVFFYIICHGIPFLLLMNLFFLMFTITGLYISRIFTQKCSGRHLRGWWPGRPRPRCRSRHRGR